jgi:hypothetical protein
MDPTRFDRLVRALVASRRSRSRDRFIAAGAPLTRRTLAALVAGTLATAGLAVEDAAGKKKRKKRNKRNNPPPPPPPPECPHPCGFNEFCSGGVCVPACIGGAQPCPGAIGGCCQVGTVCRNGACVSPVPPVPPPPFCANNGGNCGVTVCGVGQSATTNCASTITAEGQPFCIDFNKSNATGCGAECTSSDECDDGHVCLCHNNSPACECPGENGGLKVAACFPASVECDPAP